MNSNPANVSIAFDHVDVELGGRTIIKDLTLEIAGGEFVCIVGPSGSGKTSLLMVLAGLEQATSGSVRLAGQELTSLDEDALARLRRDQVGIVFQAFYLIPTMTALENVAIPLELGGDSAAMAKAEAGLRAVGLGHRLTHLPGQLSGGEQQRVALARALALKPRILLMDEPLTSLDEALSRRLRGEIRRLHTELAFTLVYATHSREEAQEIGTRALELGQRGAP
jgi:putative ABC transport system ATP-binding protein